MLLEFCKEVVAIVSSEDGLRYFEPSTTFPPYSVKGVLSVTWSMWIKWFGLGVFQRCFQDRGNGLSDRQV